MSGLTIVLEGPDGSGTTSHAGRLANMLRESGKNVLLTNEPTSGPIGSFVRVQLSAKAGIPPSALQLLFCADRAMHHEKTVRPALERGEIVLSDRSFYSTLAYGEALGLDVSWLERVNEPFVKPDLLILALPPLAVCLERLHGRAQLDMMEEDSLQARVHKAYSGMAERHPEWFVVDTSSSMDETAHVLSDRVNRFLESGH
jgi:dTMP kinase